MTREIEADGFDALSTPELLAGYASRLAELRRRGVLRTNNPPAGDYAEWLVQRALGGNLAPISRRNRCASALRVNVSDRCRPSGSRYRAR